MKKPTRKASARKKEIIQVLDRLQGCLKGKMGDKPFAEWWAEHKKEEKELEEAKLARFNAGKSRPSKRIG